MLSLLYNTYMRKRTRKAPGKAHRKGLTLLQLLEMFPTEKAATQWFERQMWKGERCCGHCGSVKTRQVPNAKPMPYWCKDCRSYFSVRTGTVLAHSKVPLRKWAVAIYLELTSLKSISSMKLHRDIGVSQPAAWFMLHRIREAWAGPDKGGPFSGPIEVDETYIGGKRRNMSRKRQESLTGRGSAGKVAVAGIKDRASNQVSAKVVPDTKSETMSRFIAEHVEPGTRIYSDDALVYHSLSNHESVKHSVGEYVRGQVHTNGVESFWSTLKRAHHGVFHKISPKHLNRYVQEFAGKHNSRNADTLNQMGLLVAGLIGKRVTYLDLIADNGLPSGARS